jgi:hypothetical protein
MSGGHWGYIGDQLDSILRMMGRDTEDEFPILAKVLKSLGPVLSSIEHDLDWHICSDTTIKNKKAFEKEAIRKILYTVALIALVETKEET